MSVFLRPQRESLHSFIARAAPPRSPSRRGAPHLREYITAWPVGCAGQTASLLLSSSHRVLLLPMARVPFYGEPTMFLAQSSWWCSAVSRFLTRRLPLYTHDAFLPTPFGLAILGSRMQSVAPGWELFTAVPMYFPRSTRCIPRPHVEQGTVMRSAITQRQPGCVVLYKFEPCARRARPCL